MSTTDAPSSPTQTEPRSEFRADLEMQFGVVRRRLAAIVEAVCGGAPKAQAITDRFGVYRKLGWQIWNVVYTDDALAAIQHLPNPKTLKVWNDAAIKAGIDAEQIRRLDEAIEQFHRSAGSHAEDRTMLDMLVDSQDGARDEETEEKWRRQQFLGNAYVWGARAKTMLVSVLIFPSASKEDYFDMVRLHALLGLVRNRPGMRWPLSQLLIRDQGKALQFGRVPLNESEAVKRTGVPLLEEFCSQPLPNVIRRQTETGMIEDDLLPGEVGQRGSTNIVTGEVLHAVAPVWAGKPGEFAHFGTGVRTPSEVIISDQLIHKDLYPGAKRELCVFGELITPISRDDRDRIPVAEKVQYLGRASDGVATAEFPQYGDLVNIGLKRSGYSADDFDVYRVRMKYPPLPVSVVLRHQMSMKPGSS